MKRGHPLFLAVPLGTMLVLGACVSEGDTIKPINNPSLACTITPCDCVSTDNGFFSSEKTAPIIWQGRDGASCPDGFRLRRIEPVKPR